MPEKELSPDTLEIIKYLKYIAKTLNVINEKLNKLDKQDKLIDQVLELKEDLKKIKKLEEKKEPIGAVWYDTVTAPDEKQFDITPLFSCLFVNNGPDEVLIQINNKYQFPLAKDGCYELNYGYPKIRKISLVCESGKSATVDIKGVY